MLTRRFGIRGHGIGGALQSEYGLGYGFVDRFCAARKRGTAHPACAGVPEAYLLHEDAQVLSDGIDTSTSSGRLQMQLLGAVAEFERALISERTKIAMAGRPRGRNGGRPKALSPKALRRAQDLYDAGGMTVKEIAAAVGVSQATLYRSLTTKGGKRTSAE